MNHYTSAAQIVAHLIPKVLQQRGLDPRVISRFDLWQGPAGVWLAAVLDPGKIAKAEPYTSEHTLHQLSTVLKGKPVLLSNTSGLRYCVLLSQPPRLPQNLPLPAWRKGVLQIGRTLAGEVTVPWEDLGNVLIAAMKREGKSTLLRSIALQALQEGHQMIVSDPQGLTFAGLRGHKQVLAFGDTLDTCVQAVGTLREEIARRTALFREANADKLEIYNQTTLDPLPRLLVMLDEFNDFVQNAPAQVADIVRQAAFGAPKYGVHLIVAGHYFDEASVGKMKGQFDTRICMRLTEAPAARMLLDTDLPTKIRVKGRAVTNRWGLIQTYYTELETVPQGDGLTETERGLIARLKADYAGRATYPALAALGYNRRAADKLREDWVKRGLARFDPGQDNALIVMV